MRAQHIDFYTHDLSDEQEWQITRAVRDFNAAQRVVNIALRGPRKLRLYLDRVSWLDITATAEPEAPEITVTSHRHIDNWFTHARRARALMQIAEWPVVLPPEVSAAADVAPDAHILMSLTLATAMLLAGLEDRDILHGETRGCLFDICARKAHRALKLRCAFICRPCRARLSERGMSSVEVVAICSVLERVRLLSLGRDPQDTAPAGLGPGTSNGFQAVATAPRYVGESDGSRRITTAGSSLRSSL